MTSRSRFAGEVAARMYIRVDGSVTVCACVLSAAATCASSRVHLAASVRLREPSSGRFARGACAGRGVSMGAPCAQQTRRTRRDGKARIRMHGASAPQRNSDPLCVSGWCSARRPGLPLVFGLLLEHGTERRRPVAAFARGGAQLSLSVTVYSLPDHGDTHVGSDDII